MKVCTTMLNTPLSKILCSSHCRRDGGMIFPRSLYRIFFILAINYEWIRGSLRFGNGIVIVTMKWEAYLLKGVLIYFFGNRTRLKLTVIQRKFGDTFTATCNPSSGQSSCPEKMMRKMVYVHYVLVVYG